MTLRLREMKKREKRKEKWKKKKREGIKRRTESEEAIKEC